MSSRINNSRKDERRKNTKVKGRLTGVGSGNQTPKWKLMPKMKEILSALMKTSLVEDRGCGVVVEVGWFDKWTGERCQQLWRRKARE